MPLSYSAPAVNITLQIIESYDIDPVPLLKELDIDPQKINNPNARFSYQKIDQLWLAAVTLSGDPCFGLRAAKFWHPSHMGALGYAWLASSSLHTALNRFSRYMAILTEGAVLNIDETATEISVHLQYKKISRQQPTRTDSFMAMLLAMCQANCGTDFHPSSIALTHAEPTNVDQFHALFNCPIQFNAAENRFNVAKEIANKPLVSFNPRLAQLSDQLVVETLAKLDKDNIIAIVKTEIIQQLTSGKLTDASVATAINMTQRSLQRKLQQQGTTFKFLLQDLRSELSQQYIQDSHLSLLDIAFMLGFSDYSSFSRAFKRWTGLPPSTFRDKL
ncbi:MAG: hypothetical protein methR_P0722 [Methyloprofundus sp.]|nr:MAG: hypothetical protein methR_P0722 [Methyloprofundus sp.]